MFDPFGDFEARGYLRNSELLKDLEAVKHLEHLNFRAHLQPALAYLQSIKGPVGYEHFLKVHEMLFRDLYEWAGQDRKQLGVGAHITKGLTDFESSERIEMAMRQAFEVGNNKAKMRAKPGYVLGMMAWAHPLLDGNGRTMLLVHTELCRRAGFAIEWTKAKSDSYLEALTDELREPDRGHLDQYLLAHT